MKTRQLNVEEMPTPCYLGRNNDWVGMHAYSPDGEIKEFIWYQNIRFKEDMNAKKTRKQMAEIITTLKLGRRADSAFGLATDYSKSDKKSGHVHVIEEDNVYGLYIEEAKRYFFDFRDTLKGREGIKELKKEDPEKYKKTHQGALAHLPRL